MKNKIKMFVVFCLMFLCGMLFSSEAQAATRIKGTWELYKIKNDIHLPVVYPSTDKPAERQTTFSLKEDSYVIFQCSDETEHLELRHIPLTVRLYKNDTLLKTIKWSQLQVEGKFSTIVLPVGDYTVKATYDNPDQWPANAYYNVQIGYLPVTEMFNVTTEYQNGKLVKYSVGVSGMSEFTSIVRYRKGAISLKDKDNSKYWDIYEVDGSSLVLTKKCADRKCKTFKIGKVNITKTGDYTFNAVDKFGTTVSQTFHIVVKDKTKPSVSGVKNNKTYKKKVTIKFSDSGSGIKSAKLNGKKIKSGYKVSKKGSYKLVVTDVAGNKTTINFKIKK